MADDMEENDLDTGAARGSSLSQSTHEQLCDVASAWASRDYVVELSSQPHFARLLKEVYDCQLLCNPWLAARIAARGPVTNRAGGEQNDPVGEVDVERRESTIDSLSDDEDDHLFARTYGAPWPDFGDLCRIVQSTLAQGEAKSADQSAKSGALGIAGGTEVAPDPQIEVLSDKLLLHFRHLKQQVLEINKTEANFRAGYRKEIQGGLWSKHMSRSQDSSSATGEDLVSPFEGQQHPQGSQLVVDDPGHRDKWLVRGEPPSHQGSSQRAAEDLESMEIESQELNWADAKKNSSGKFDKRQVVPLTEWLLANSDEPYPSVEDKLELARKSGLSPQQVQNWFINMRKRHWTPIKKGTRKPRTFLDYVIKAAVDRQQVQTSGS